MEMAEQAENTAKEQTEDTQTVRQSSAGGVPNRKWFVAFVMRNREELCRKQLEERNVEAYVACQKQTRIYSNRHRREVTRIIIPNLVFVRVTEQERLQVLKSTPLIQFFMTDKAGHPNEYGRHPFAIIPDGQMERLRFMLFQSESPVDFTSTPLRLGDHIRVVRGQLAGLEGSVTRQGNQTYLVVTLDLLGSALVTISPDDLEKIA